MVEPDEAYGHLSVVYPELASLFDQVGRPTVRSETPRPLAESVVGIVVGQMLSGAAAETIYKRLKAAADAKGLPSTHLLSQEDLRAAGVSSFKARAISEFSQEIATNPRRFERWSKLPYEDLVLDVAKLWGLSSWSASILALSHFGMSDVWPAEDGSIRRAVEKIRTGISPEFDPSPASPYRSYLARSLWAALDNRLI